VPCVVPGSLLAPFEDRRLIITGHYEPKFRETLTVHATLKVPVVGARGAVTGAVVVVVHGVLSMCSTSSIALARMVAACRPAYW
jgi:hypothetical protein